MAKPTRDDDERPPAPPAPRAAVATIIMVMCTFVMNVFLLILASGGPHDWADGWGDLFVAFILAPVANFLLIMLAVILEPWATDDGLQKGSYMLVSVIVPIIACGIVFLLILSGTIRH